MVDHNLNTIKPQHSLNYSVNYKPKSKSTLPWDSVKYNFGRGGGVDCFIHFQKQANLGLNKKKPLKDGDEI